MNSLELDKESWGWGATNKAVACRVGPAWVQLGLSGSCFCHGSLAHTVVPSFAPRTS